MNQLKYSLLLLSAILVSYGCIFAQEDPAAESAVFGKPYKVREIKVWLTDEATGGPYANKEVSIRYYWIWDVIEHTPEADRRSNIRDVKLIGWTDADGLVIVPGLIVNPSRPLPPPGAEYSEPRFWNVGISIQDATHNTGLAIFQPGYDLTDENGEVRRIVHLYPRPPKPKK